MTLTKNQFATLTHLLNTQSQSQRDIARATKLSLGSVNSALKELKDQHYIDSSLVVVEAGKEALEPYKVKNAIIMAAGTSSRFAPISYERPKGMLRVRGEVLIERQIRQLQEAGITDITVAVGYMKEQFFYLEDKFGVKIRVNEAYAERNNNSTLMLVREELDNTYICSSDNYFTENVFEPYVYQAYYAATFFEGETEEYLLKTGTGNRIVAVQIGGADEYGMLGHAYFDREFSKKFREILEAEYELPETASKLWEDIYRSHVDELPMVMRPYDEGVVFEFDSLNDLRSFDPDFIENVDSSILDNISRTLKVARSEISDVVPISQGLTNLSCKFSVAEENYVYRHPGAGTDAIINRQAETFSQNIGYKLGLDDTYIYEDPREGWKISRFLDNCTELDYHNEEQVTEALRMVRTLHKCGIKSDFSFDVYEKTLELIEMLDEHHRASFPDFLDLYDLIAQLAVYLSEENVEPVLCHNDFYSPNLLVVGKKLYLIDWEYSGMSDYASDLGTFICCSDFTYDESLRVFETYFGRPLTQDELIHCVAYVALSGYYWFIWALYKDACGAPVGEWLYLWYKAAKLYGRAAKELITQKKEDC